MLLKFRPSIFYGKIKNIIWTLFISLVIAFLTVSCSTAVDDEVIENMPGVGVPYPETIDFTLDFPTDNLPVSAGIPKPVPGTAAYNDYWHDGDVLTYNKASKGNGIDIFIVGDAFIWEDLKKGGRWEYEAKKHAVDFLNCEVIRNFREYFNVQILFSESNERYVSGSVNKDIKFNSKGGSSSSFDSGAVKNAIRPYVKNVGETYIMFLVYSIDGANQVGGWAWGQFAVNSIFDDEVNVFPSYWVQHEFAGHVFGGLADEYSSGGNKRHPQYDTDHQHGWDLVYFSDEAINITGWPLHDPSDPADPYRRNKLPPWKDFLGRPEYAAEQLGAYEGGSVSVLGRWHATPNLCYMNTSRTAGFCVICRYAMWLKIQLLGIESADVPYADRLNKYQDENKNNPIDGEWWHIFKHRWPTAYSLGIFLEYDKINLRS